MQMPSASAKSKHDRLSWKANSKISHRRDSLKFKILQLASSNVTDSFLYNKIRYKFQNRTREIVQIAKFKLLNLFDYS